MWMLTFMLIHGLFLIIVRNIWSYVEEGNRDIYSLHTYMYSTVLDQRTMYFLDCFAEKDTLLVFYNKTPSGISRSTIPSLISVILSLDTVLARRKKFFLTYP
jgi:hypothetical protein